ncbi:uncharacterized protein F4822DRAFT_294942 [Hypoxylon trugodes]|uniref:uncharacterized protein n=1 Tax=Hypoxylon trugodes TaxID=326681 RepID=UPI0021978B19|nr:uncharacterized protein F4822DRAFT_294942 [Hypoxylon trugodes]KAI1387886.1 hypothetical protein F4822DRAFT_294942 [Hypoxylon trugodes]
MDDQFNGRTDDDLFADDFEPVESQEQAPKAVQKNAPIVTESRESRQPPASTQEPIPATQPTSKPPVHRSLAQSRHANPKPAPSSSSHHNPRPRKNSPKPATIKPVVTPTPTTTVANPQKHDVPETSPIAVSKGSSDTASVTSSSGGSSSSKKARANNNGTKKSHAAKPGQNTALADRLASGANPRTKLTESELAAKMEQMRILNAEKTRRFEQAERDSRSHAIAYEKGMEEARRRRAEEAERRRKGDEERRRMDEERAANRERKLRAMGGGANWDEGREKEEESARRAGFRGANGGVRGAKSGMAGSRFAERDGDVTPREFSPDDFRGRGRGGRGRGGSSRGGGRGRGGSNHDGERGGNRGGAAAATQNGNKAQPQKAPQVPPTADDFPALPTPKRTDTSKKAAEPVAFPSLSPGANSPPIGKWDDEMAALDDKAKAGL